MKTALYPGTFDPITNGHLDILERACHIFDRVIVAISPNLSKGPYFEPEIRAGLVEPNLPAHGRAEVRIFEGLVVDYAREVGAVALIRGLRAVSDFEFEFQMTQMNRELAPDIETVFFMPNERYFFTSSNLIKTVSKYDPERIRRFVPPNVAESLHKQFGPKAGLDNC